MATFLWSPFIFSGLIFSYYLIFSSSLSAMGVGRASKLEGDGAGSRFRAVRLRQIGGSLALICTVLWIPHERRDCINLCFLFCPFWLYFCLLCLVICLGIDAGWKH